MQVKLIILDLDGTLLAEDHMTISKRNRRALQLASEAGITLAIGSGRTYSVLKNVLKQTDVIDYVMMSNGAALMDNHTKEQSQVKEMPYEVWLPLYQELKKHRAVFEVYHNGQSYIEKESRGNFKNEWIGEDFLQELTENMVEVDSLIETLEGEPLEKIDVIQTPEEEIEALEEAFSKMPQFACSTSIPGNIEVNLRGVNKGEGTLRLCEILQIKPEEVMAFGDANNDLEMMQIVGYSYAMGNASEEIKEVSKFVTDTNGNDGVAKGIEAMLKQIGKMKKGSSL